MWHFWKYLPNWFVPSKLISECYNTQIICTKIFIKFLLQDKKWQRLRNQLKDILQQKNVVAGKNFSNVGCFDTISVHRWSLECHSLPILKTYVSWTFTDPKMDPKIAAARQIFRGPSLKRALQTPSMIQIYQFSYRNL